MSVNHPIRAKLLAAALTGVIAVGCLVHALVTLQPGFGDEFVVVQNVWHMLLERTIIPPHAIYPALYSYLIVPATVAGAAVRVWLGAPPSYQDLSELMALEPLTGFLPARLVTMLCWGGCLWVICAIGRELWCRRAPALLAAASFAAAIGPLRYSGYALPDVPMMLMMALALLFAVRLALGQLPGRNSLLAGLMAGLAIATKYQALAGLIPAVLAVWLAGGPRVGHLGRAAVGGLVGFVVGCPGWVLAPGHYWRGLVSVREHMAAGHIGADGVPLLGQIELLLRADAPLVVLGVLAGVVLLATRGRDGNPAPPDDNGTGGNGVPPLHERHGAPAGGNGVPPLHERHDDRRDHSGRALLVIFVAALAVLLVAAPAKKQSLQFLFGLYPPLCLLIGAGVAALGGRARTAAGCLASLALVASMAIGGVWVYRATALPDSTVVARDWLNQSLPEDAVIAVDWNYVPRLLDQVELEGLRAGLQTDWLRSRYAKLRGFRTVPMGWTEETLLTTEAQYVVTSSWCFDRFFEFGYFTGRPPAPDSPLLGQFEQTRRFYEALLAGHAGWGLAQCIETGNGPRVLVLQRGAQQPCEPTGVLPWVGVPDWPCR